jgi:hypothetical protein
MRHNIVKVFPVWDFDREERWLNEMSQKGLALIAVGYCNYTFEDCGPGEYTVRLELLDNLPAHRKASGIFALWRRPGRSI